MYMQQWFLNNNHKRTEQLLDAEKYNLRPLKCDSSFLFYVFCTSFWTSVLSTSTYFFVGHQEKFYSAECSMHKVHLQAIQVLMPRSSVCIVLIHKILTVLQLHMMQHAQFLLRL